MRNVILLLLVCTGLAYPLKAQDTQQVPDGERITLQEAIDIALKNNFQLKTADNNLELAEDRILGAKADFLPSISGDLSGQSTKGQQFNNTTLQLENRTRNSISGSIGANLAIFQGFRNIINLRRSRIDEDYQQENKERARETVIFDAASGFLQVVLNQQLLKIAQENLVSTEQQLEQVKAQVEVGSVATVDQYNQESIVAGDELSVIQRENDVEFSKTQLIGTLQLDPEKDYSFVTPDLEDFNPVPRTLSLSDLIDQALANRHDLMAQKLLIDRNKADLGLARANYYPNLSLRAGYSTNYYDTYQLPIGENEFTTVGFRDQFFDQNVNKYVGFSLNVPIFNNLDTRLNVQSTKVNYQNSRFDYQNLKYTVLQEVRQAYNDYRSYTKQLESSAKALRAAKLSYETQQERYNVGAGTLIELSDANSQYVQAQADRAQAILRFIFQQKLLDYYLGKLDEDIQLTNN